MSYDLFSLLYFILCTCVLLAVESKHYKIKSDNCIISIVLADITPI